MESKKLFLELDGSQIEFKQLLKKEFLELSMRPISTANPNRNNSWFTRESLIASKDTFKNKPILGYFENGDFVSHNGDWKKDPETDLDYWDTTGTKGERPIGLIRENDEVQVIDDPATGLSWVVLTCALWTQYNYKQVKRLLKDAKKAKQNGGPVKNVSVEVDITDWEIMDNGVTKINAFNLVGITILGSRNGVKVESGIADAELSVVDIMGTDVYEKQLTSLRLAYEKLDGSENVLKEDFSEMDLKNQEQNGAPEENANLTTLAAGADENAQATDSNVLANEGDGNSQVQFENDNHEAENSGPDTIHQNNEKDANEDVCPKCGKNPCECKKHENESCVCLECGEESERDPIRDVAWLISDVSWNIQSFQDSIEYYERHEEVPARDYILAVLRRFKAQAEENEKELAGLMVKVAEGVSDEDLQYAKDLCDHCDCKSEFAAYIELLGKYNVSVKEIETITTERDDLKTKFEAIEKAEAHDKFMAEAKEIIGKAKLSDEIALSFETECDNGTIASLDELKSKIGVKLYELAASAVNPTTTFDAPVVNPEMNSFTDTEAKKKDKWEKLREDIKK